MRLLRSVLDVRSAIESECTEDIVDELICVSNPTYKDLRVNEPLCQTYVDEMAYLGEKVALRQDECFTASTDMGECLAGPGRAR